MLPSGNKSIHRKLPTRPWSKKDPLYVGFSTAASFVVLVVATFWWLNQSPSVSPQQYAMADIMVHPVSRVQVIQNPNAPMPSQPSMLKTGKPPSPPGLLPISPLKKVATTWPLYFYAGQYNEANIRFATLLLPTLYIAEVRWFYGLSSF